MYVCFIIRVKGLENTFKNSSDILISILFVLVFGIFIKIIMGDVVENKGITSKILTLFHLDNSYYLLGIILLLSLLGEQKICGILWVLVIIAGMTEFITCGKYLGDFKSVVFILSSFMGFIFYFKYEWRVIQKSFERFKERSNVIGSSIKTNLNQSKKMVQSGVETIIEKRTKNRNDKKNKELE